MAQTEPFKSVVGREVNPGPDVKTDEDISLWLKKYLTTVHHTASTCSMLPRDKGGVVDPELKVYGTEKLRVVDLSVVPLIPSAHTQSIVYAIAEQAADIIKGTFKDHLVTWVEDYISRAYSAGEAKKILDDIDRR